ncbi:hypothetical protein D3C81_2260640 [compost metagenome]
MPVKLIQILSGSCELWEPLLILCSLLRTIIRCPCQVIPEHLLTALCPGDGMFVQQIILKVYIDVFVFLH